MQDKEGGAGLALSGRTRTQGLQRKQNKGKGQINITEYNLMEGIELIKNHSLFNALDGWIRWRDKNILGKATAAVVDSDGYIFVNENVLLEPKQWAYAIAHCLLHLAFGHFDARNMPGEETTSTDGKKEWKVKADKKIWNLACDIYITKFLQDMKFGKPLSNESFASFGGSLSDERKIYQHLLENGFSGEEQLYGTAAMTAMDMVGLDKPLVYDEEGGEHNWFMEAFAEALACSAQEAVSISGGHGKLAGAGKTFAEDARDWFINHYPMLGSLAAAFKIIEDRQFCMQEQISIAAVDAGRGEIYINPSAGIYDEELRFVMAHELLHAGLAHHERRQGRDPHLWNVACDYVINGWLHDMQIGEMPRRGLLYDEAYKDWSAESIYDELVKEIRKNKKLETFRGHGKGDILDGPGRTGRTANGVSMDEFCKSALSDGLEYHIGTGRGFVPAGLIEEIRALAMPPVPWDVELARWFDDQFVPLEKRHTYARPSRRQGATPDIPRPRYVKQEIDEDSRTFGVVVDTSGSMSAKMIGMALGSIASYAAAKDVPYARVVFCDADAYDAGYMSPEDIAGRIEVKGRGGTRMQPGVDLLQQAKDFPKDGPVLIITDGMIEEKLAVRREHAFLIPKGWRLPFKAKGKVFYFA